MIVATLVIAPTAYGQKIIANVNVHAPSDYDQSVYAVRRYTMRGLRSATVFYTAFTLAAACAVADTTESIAEASEAKGPAAYAPPVGIPVPSFGINESHHTYAGKTFEAGGFKYRDAGHGPYTHYIDNTHPAAANEENPFGTPEKPRRDLFDRLSVSLPAGSVVEIHGGPYRYEGWKRIEARGTPEKPVFVRAVSADNKVRIQGGAKTHHMRLDASYFILENIEFYDRAFPQIWEHNHHIALRYLEVHNPPGRGEAGGSAIGTGSGTRDIVVYKNHVHHNERTRIRDGKRTADDCHGVNVGSGIERIWILDNHIHHNSGDAVQGSHRAKIAPRYVYIGGNLFHEDRENGVDLKTIRDVVVSQNTLYGYRRSATSSGDAVVVGSNGYDPEMGFGPDNVWILFNRIKQSRTGIRVEGVRNGRIIGNFIHDIAGSGITLDIDPDSRCLAIAGNTIASVREGIHHHWQVGIDEVVIESNLITDFSLSALSLGTGVGNVTTLNNNLFWMGGKKIAMIDNLNTDYPRETLEDRTFYASTGEGIVAAWNRRGVKLSGTRNLVGNPALAVDADGHPGLGAGSAAIGKGTPGTFYDAFRKMYGLDIRVDVAGRPRPKSGPWDIGAFERGPSVASPDQ